MWENNCPPASLKKPLRSFLIPGPFIHAVFSSPHQTRNTPLAPTASFEFKKSRRLSWVGHWAFSCDSPSELPSCPNWTSKQIWWLSTFQRSTEDKSHVVGNLLVAPTGYPWLRIDLSAPSTWKKWFKSSKIWFRLENRLPPLPMDCHPY